MWNPNGAPKAGNHMLIKLLRGYKGVATTQVKSPPEHIPYSSGVKIDNQVLIVRNPRNIAGSWDEFTRHTPKDIEGHVSRVKMEVDDTPFIEKLEGVIKETKRYIGWYQSKKVINVRFEELLSDREALVRLGEQLGLEPTLEQFRSFYGGTATFTGVDKPRFHIWQETEIDGKIVWTDEIIKEWERLGGVELEEAFGYDMDRQYFRRVNG